MSLFGFTRSKSAPDMSRDAAAAADAARENIGNKSLFSSEGQRRRKAQELRTKQISAADSEAAQGKKAISSAFGDLRKGFGATASGMKRQATGRIQKGRDKASDFKACMKKCQATGQGGGKRRRTKRRRKSRKRKTKRNTKRRRKSRKQKTKRRRRR